jgi:ubiquinone/menaquinone biosynthesis C-methylase UbiE
MNSQREGNGVECPGDAAFQFDEIAFLYDELMSGVPYRAWVSYLQKILDNFRCRPNTILDLCCGTGSVSMILARQGYRVTGVDISPEMIARARLRAQSTDLPIEYHVQDASELRLGRRFDLVISLFDSLNYVLDSAALQQVFHRVSESLEAGGLFVFDVNTELALAGGYFDQSNIGSRSPLIYNWRSSYDSASRICRIQMDFVCGRHGAERRVSVVHRQRAYDLDELRQMLSSAGLDVLAVYDAYSLRKATSHSDRAFFVARK